MLNFIFGRQGFKEWTEFVPDSRLYFSRYRKPTWFEDPFIKKVLREIDGSEVISGEVLRDKFGRDISTLMMSTGCKTLCCIYYGEPGKVFYGTTMGDNCYPYLIELSKSRDITVVLEHYPMIESVYFEEGLISVNNKVVTEDEFDDCYADWVEAREAYWRKYDEERGII